MTRVFKAQMRAGTKQHFIRWLFAISMLLGVRVPLADGDPSGPAKEAIEIPAGSGVIEEFLACAPPEGTSHQAVATPADMPWRVSIGKPKTSPQYGSRTAGREAAIESMRTWESALKTRLPWFALEFVENDKEAPIQIKWKRRTTGKKQGWAGPRCRMKEGRVQAGGEMEISVRSCPTCSAITVDDIRVLVAHEFGHILGLGHCLECDSAMNYSWSTRGRIIVTAVDIDAVVRRLARAGSRPDVSARLNPPGRELDLDPSDLVELAAGTSPISFANATCESPFVLKRSCSKRKGAKKRKKIDGLEMRLAATKDGTVILVTPDDPTSLAAHGVGTFSTNERFYAVTDATEAKGVTALRATALVQNRLILGYLIEFDGDAWSALGL